MHDYLIMRNQLDLQFDRPEYDGDTFDEQEDGDRLRSAHDRIAHAMRDGKWRTLAEIMEIGGCTEAAASARMRDFRKERFKRRYGVTGMESRREAGGLWQYRLLTREENHERTVDEPREEEERTRGVNDPSTQQSAPCVGGHG